MALVLVVDDDADAVELLLDMLGDEHEVVGTTDPVKAMELLRSRPVDLLITDVRMPSHNGFTLIRMAQSIRPEIGVIVVSAYYSRTDPACRAIVEGFSPVALAKPFTVPAVTAAVATALAARGRNGAAAREDKRPDAATEGG